MKSIFEMNSTESFFLFLLLLLFLFQLHPTPIFTTVKTRNLRHADC
jgi:hypothetical protein